MKEEKTFHLGDLVQVNNAQRPSVFHNVGIVVGEDTKTWVMYKVFISGNGTHWFHPYELKDAEY